jgi:hypothetical protein
VKPLVYWCRWHQAKLRLHGRDETAVWGELVFASESKPFHFNLRSRELTVGAGDAARRIQLDEMGVEVSS